MSLVAEVGGWRAYCKEMRRRTKQGKDFEAWMQRFEHTGILWNAWMWLRAWTIRKALRKDRDRFTVVVGKGGEGKSTLASQLCAAVSPETFDIHRCSGDYTSFVRSLAVSVQYDSLLMDEAVLVVHSSDRSAQAMEMEKLSVIMRKRNWHVVLCMTDLKLLKRHYREMRIDTLLYVPLRGRYKGVTGAGIHAVVDKYSDVKGNIDLISLPDGTWSYGTFSKSLPDVNGYREAYEQFKNDTVDGFIQGMIEGERVRGGKLRAGYSVQEFIRLTGRSESNLYELLRHGKLRGNKIGSKWIISAEELDFDDGKSANFEFGKKAGSGDGG